MCDTEEFEVLETGGWALGGYQGGRGLTGSEYSVDVDKVEL